MRLGHAFTCTLLCLPLVLAGCALQQTAPLAPESGIKFTGSVHGGQQPIVGAHIYLFAANTTSYGQPSVSLLNPATTGLSDSIGAYVTTDSTGSFTITGDYSCTPNTQVYLYSLGGDPGAGVNSAAGLLAALGNCPSSGSFLASIPFINEVNEVTTIAAAYAMAGFATDATHVSSSGTTLAQTGIANAFANAANLADIASGAALAKTPAGNGTVPQATINTLGNILASCVNSTGPASTPCSTLLSSTLGGGSTGTTPTDTATAAINIAHNPGVNITSLYGLSTPTPPFAPVVGSVPNDFTIAVNFTGGGISIATGVAVDAVGNVWMSNNFSSRITELAAGTGAFLSGSGGFGGGGLNRPDDIAVDTLGNVWATNGGNASLTKLNGTNGNPISGTNGYASSGLTMPQRIAFDGTGNAWVTDGEINAAKFDGTTGAAISGTIGYYVGGGQASGIAIDTSGSAWIANFSSIVKLNSDGRIASGSNGFTGGGLAFATRIAIDASGNAWTSNVSNNSVSKFSSTGVAISPSTGYIGGGLAGPAGVAIDGDGNVWASNQNNNSVTCLNGGTGAAITPSTGYTGNGLRVPDGVAIDGSGNLWVINFGNANLTEFIGVAAPVVTPLAAGVQNNTLGTRP